MITALLRILVASALLAVATTATGQPAAVYYRLFLTDGSSLASYGEFARVADRVVFSMPLGGSSSAPDLQLVSLPAERIDWVATERYADAARAAHYAATRGEVEYAALSDAVAGALSDIARTDDPQVKLRIAAGARRRIADWSRASYGYRALDVGQLSSLLDEVVAEIRTAGGDAGGFELQFVAMVAPPPTVPILPPPSVRESAEQALAAAGIAGDSVERRSLLSAVARSLAGSREEWATSIASRAQRELQQEGQVDGLYARLTRSSVRRASTRAAAADVKGVQAVIAQVLAQDDRLGRKRPAEVGALLATLDVRLDAARRLRLARDRWLFHLPLYRAYSRDLSESRAILARLRRVLDDIRELAGPPRRALLRAQVDTSEVSLTLSRLKPPDDLLPVHALFVSAVQLAANACRQRLDAISTGDEQTAWAASSAAAGSLMLMDRARQDLTHWLKPPSLP